MRLWVNPVSPFCRTAALYLAAKAIPFEPMELESGADRERLRACGRGEVPVLETERGFVAGASAICDLADLVAPQPRLIPDDPMARLACRTLEDVARSTTDALQFLLHLTTFRRPELVERVPGLAGRLDAALAAHYAFLDAALRTTPSFGDGRSRTDLVWFPMVSSLVGMGRRIPPFCAALTAWFARTAAEPNVALDLERTARSAAAQAGSPDPYFRPDRIHWRSHRVEWACRLGLGRWLASEIEQGRAFFSQPPQAEHVAH